MTNGINISFEQLFHYIAGACSVISLISTSIISATSNDPFLKYYILVTFVSISVFWGILKWSSGDIQKEIVKIWLKLIGFSASLTVVWRFINNYFYYCAPVKFKKPLGLDEGPYHYWPYYLLLIPAIALIVSLSIMYTRNENLDNRFPIIKNCAYLACYLLICRLIWEISDSFFRLQL